MLYTTPIKTEPEYRGVLAIRFHDQIFRIYRNQRVFAEFYDIEAGREYLNKITNGKSDSNTSTD
jgi:hypothetical protein